jgi:2-polyprenyl-6-methoxyphenol hydroxylase-like FAD-dependent oxidoreductase
VGHVRASDFEQRCAWLSMPVRRVVIVGAGVAGLSCALACARAGGQVQVLEARPALTGTPAHLEIVPNLLRDLARLGVAEDCVRRGFAYNGVAVVDEWGQAGFEVPTPTLAGDGLPPAAGIAYDDFLDVLRTRAAAAGAVVDLGRRVSAVEPASGRVVTAEGQQLDADLVVLATGPESPLVQAHFGTATRTAPLQTWWHALLPRPAALDRATWMAGLPGRRLLLVPIGMSRAGVAVIRTSEVAEGTHGSALLETLARWGELPRRLAALMTADTPTVLRPVSGALLDAPWYRGALLCAGASAHAVAPPFGQSAAQAVEDALVLGELMSAGLQRAALLERFMQRRGERARHVHALTTRAARWIAQPEPATDLIGVARELTHLVAQPA